MLSTPLICCSIGVATDCSMVWASAPTYIAEIWISGGAMAGNCATGRDAMTTAPTITVNMAITIATIGRLIKNLDIISFPAVPLQGSRPGVNLDPLADFLYTFGDDSLARP